MRVDEFNKERQLLFGSEPDLATPGALYEFALQAGRSRENGHSNLLLFDEILDAVEPASQLRQGRGIGNPNMLIGTESLSRNYGHVRLGEKPLRELHGR